MCRYTYIFLGCQLFTRLALRRRAPPRTQAGSTRSVSGVHMRRCDSAPLLLSGWVSIFSFCVGVATYLNASPCAYVFDDTFAIVTNPDVQPDAPLSPLWRHDFWGKPLTAEDSHKSYRPLTTLSFRLETWWTQGTYPTLPHPTPTYPTLRHPTPPCPTLPHPTPPYRAWCRHRAQGWRRVHRRVIRSNPLQRAIQQPRPKHARPKLARQACVRLDTPLAYRSSSQIRRRFRPRFRPRLGREGSQESPVETRGPNGLQGGVQKGGQKRGQKRGQSPPPQSISRDSGVHLPSRWAGGGGTLPHPTTPYPTLPQVGGLVRGVERGASREGGLKRAGVPRRIRRAARCRRANQSSQ